MDLQHAGIFIGIWILLWLAVCYILAVIEGNKKKKLEEKEKYDKSPIGVFWRNLK